jgi:hypothetical protein
VQPGEKLCQRPAAGLPTAADSPGIHFRARQQVVDAADTVPSAEQTEVDAKQDQPSSALDPVSWTSSERWIRCPEWPRNREAGGLAGGLRTTSRRRRSGWCWTRARPWARSLSIEHALLRRDRADHSRASFACVTGETNQVSLQISGIIRQRPAVDVQLHAGRTRLTAAGRRLGERTNSASESCGGSKGSRGFEKSAARVRHAVCPPRILAHTLRKRSRS